MVLLEVFCSVSSAAVCGGVGSRAPGLATVLYTTRCVLLERFIRQLATPPSGVTCAPARGRRGDRARTRYGKISVVDAGAEQGPKHARDEERSLSVVTVQTMV